MNHKLETLTPKSAVSSTAAVAKSATKTSEVRCADCNLEFTSDAILRAHLLGSKHAKLMKSRNILYTLKQNNVNFSEDQKSNYFSCNVCNVHLNSIQQLNTHINGSRHKKKTSTGNWDGKEVISKSAPIPNPGSYTLQTEMLTCQPCNKFFNSKSQLEVHLASYKHSSKLKFLQKRNKRYIPYDRQNDNAASSVHTYSANPQYIGPGVRPKLSHCFVSSGYQL